MVDLAFLRCSEIFLDPLIRLLWGFGITEFESVKYSMNVGIDADVWEIVEMREDHLCCFDADSGEGDDFFDRIWDDTIKLFSQNLCRLEDVC